MRGFRLEVGTLNHDRPYQKVSALNYSKVEHLANLLIFPTLWRT